MHQPVLQPAVKRAVMKIGIADGGRLSQYKNAAGVSAFFFPEYFAVTSGRDLLVEEILPGGIRVQHQVVLIRRVANEKGVVLPIVEQAKQQFQQEQNHDSEACADKLE